MRILLAEDEKELSNALVAVLTHNHYAVDPVYNGTDALDWALAGEYDALILDIMMPGRTGLEVLEELRRQGVASPVLLLTAKAELDDRITGLDTGADDYLTKPFAMGELLARLRAITRRKEAFVSDRLVFGDLVLDRRRFTLSCGENTLRLGNKEFQMMELLMRDPNCVISTDRFMDRVWGYDARAEMNVVWVYISYLRKKLESLGSHVAIKASRGAGYQLEAAV